MKGDFSHFTDSAGNLIPIYDPATTRSDGAGGFTRDQFSCNGVLNVICPARFSTISSQFLPYVPVADLPGNTQQSYYQCSDSAPRLPALGG